MARRGRPKDEIRRLLYQTLLPTFTLQEVGEMFGVSRQAVEQLAPGRAGFKGPGGPRIPTWELPDRADRHRVLDLCNLGMTVLEAVELLGYKWGGQRRRVDGRVSHLGGAGDWTWRGWKHRVELEVRLLVARDAIEKGATLREAAEVSGLNRNSINAWSCTGRLPRSLYRQGYGRPVLRALEQSDGASTEEKPR